MKRMKILTERGKYYYKIWLEIYDGGSGQWLWVCRDGLAYIFLEVIDLVEYCGRDATVHWVAEVSVVDLMTATPKTLAEALQSWGSFDIEDFKFTEEQGRLNIACCLREYGAKAPLWNKSARLLKEGDRAWGYDEMDPEFRKLRADARRFAEEELFDEESRNHILDTRVVNKLGQTGRSYMRGTEGLWEHLRMIKDKGEEATPEQRLVLSMYQNAGQTLGAGRVPKDLL